MALDILEVVSLSQQSSMFRRPKTNPLCSLALAATAILSGMVVASSATVFAEPPKRQNFTVYVPAKALVQESPGTLKIQSSQPVSVQVQGAKDSQNWSVRSSIDSTSHIVSLKTLEAGPRLIVTIAAP